MTGWAYIAWILRLSTTDYIQSSSFAVVRLTATCWCCCGDHPSELDDRINTQHDEQIVAQGSIALVLLTVWCRGKLLSCSCLRSFLLQK